VIGEKALEFEPSNSPRGSLYWEGQLADYGDKLTM
jgi:hypothetical protein